jgi:hypothetical protein
MDRGQEPEIDAETPPGPEPEPVKYVTAVLWRDPAALDGGLAGLQELLGGIDYQGPDHPFDRTDYYEPEMGSGLLRRVVSFHRLQSPALLAEVKLACVAVENRLRMPGGRSVNLDVGYLDVHKVVLASLKYGGQKIYLSGGVYADMVCRYSRGEFHEFEWTFPDFKDRGYSRELLEIRARYKAQLRERARKPGG